MAASPNFIAGGSIPPSTIVTQSGDFAVVVAASDTVTVAGVAQDGTHLAPGVNGADSYAALVNQGIRVHGIGEECLVITGATTFAAGVRLKSDSSGHAIPVAGTETYSVNSVGFALEGSNAANLLIRMVVEPANGRQA